LLALTLAALPSFVLVSSLGISAALRFTPAGVSRLSFPAGLPSSLALPFPNLMPPTTPNASNAPPCRGPFLSLPSAWRSDSLMT
jgi:hypothetical protein